MAKKDTVIVEAVKEEREKSWCVIYRGVESWLAKSMCDREGEYQFVVPTWLIKKMDKAADERLAA